MTERDGKNSDAVLGDDVLQQLSSAQIEQDVPPAVLEKLSSRVMGEIDLIEDPLKTTVRNDEGEWIVLAPGIEKKTLFHDTQSGSESFLLRAAAGAVLPPHGHDADEHCLVLDGDVNYGERIYLAAGDYHLAKRGSDHEIARTRSGALVYLQIAPSV